MRLQLLLISLLTIASATVSAGGLRFSFPNDTVKHIDANSVKTVTGRLVTSRDGDMVFRSPNVNVDIPVTAADANPLKANAQSVLRADTKAQESIGTLPVSAKVVGGAAGSVELSSNVSNVWNQIKPQFENRAVANRLQQAVNNYEANAVGTLSSSTKGWAPAITAATLKRRRRDPNSRQTPRFGRDVHCLSTGRRHQKRLCAGREALYRIRSRSTLWELRAGCG